MRRAREIALAAAILAGGSAGARAATPRFVEVAGESGIHFRHENGQTGRFHYPEIMGAGVILFDSDGDGDLDIYFLTGNFLGERPVDPSITNVLYRNDLAGGALQFTDATAPSGLGD